MNKMTTEISQTNQGKASDIPASAPVDMICLRDVEQTDINWLWFPYIPFGKITAMLGNPGEGKTYMAMEMIAACTGRKLLPGMKEPPEPFNVIYQTAEDGLGGYRQASPAGSRCRPDTGFYH